MAEKRDRERPLPPAEEEEDLDDYIRTAAAGFHGENLDLIREWLPHQAGDPGRVTAKVLVDATMYSQIQVLDLALKHGDLLKKDTRAQYAGWTLMHFAVEGAEMNMGDAGGDRLTKMVSVPDEVLGRQLDVILKLAQHGVPISEPDDRGRTPSFMACNDLEVRFLEGSLLLDILAALKALRDSPCSSGLAETMRQDAPGLSSIPSVQGWKQSAQRLVKWSYQNDHFDILKFCHNNKVMNLASNELMISDFSMRAFTTYQYPLIVDAVHREKYQVLRIVLEASSNPSGVLSQDYECTFGNAGRRKESILSFACRKFFEHSESILRSLLSFDVIGCHLTNITLSGMGLSPQHFPAVLMHNNLKTLDISRNNLDSLPSRDPLNSGHLNWDCAQLEMLNISSNLFTSIHEDIFALPSLKRLLAADNKIQTVPIEMWTAPVLKQLDLSGNLIQCLPCPLLDARSVSFSSAALNVSFTSSQGGTSGLLNSTKYGYINYDIQSTDQLHNNQSGFALEVLDLNSNSLSEVPVALPCLAPRLTTLRINNNNLTDLGPVSCYPSLLQTLDTTNNKITSGFQIGFETNFVCPQAQYATVQSECSHANHTQLNNLKFIYLSNNQLEEFPVEFEKQEVLDVSQSNSPPSPLPPPSPSFTAATGTAPPNKKELIFPRLQGLRLSNNKLSRVPESIHKLVKLCELTIDGNERIYELPLNLHKLTNLFLLKYDGICAPVVEEIRHLKNTPEILYYLKARDCKAVLNCSMRLLVIGHYGKGKSTVINYLRSGEKAEGGSFFQRTRLTQPPQLTTEERQSTVGIECGKWECSPMRKGGNKEQKINFYTWDFAGQEEYYVTHQSFLINRALYLLVWNVMDREAGIDKLSVWLQNLHARAHGASHTVLVVGTHFDLVPKGERDHLMQMWSERLEKYCSGRSTSKNYPQIKAFHFVGLPKKGKLLNFDTLVNLIYDTAMSMESPRDPDSKVYQSLRTKILKEKIPVSYERLRERIEELAANSRTKGIPPILAKETFCEFVQDIIPTTEEVETAVEYLYATTGVVLHFNIPKVNEYFIIDPQRFFDLCSLIISPDYVSSLVQSCLPSDPNCGLLSCRKMNEEFQKQKINAEVSQVIRELLQHQRIIHRVNKEYCLVPSAINPEPALSRQLEQGTFPRPTQQQLQTLDSGITDSITAMALTAPSESDLRVVVSKLIYRRFLILPPMASGFWSKLIALFLQKQDFIQLICDAAPTVTPVLPKGPSHRLRVIISTLELYWSYWKTGIMMYLDGECILRVNSFEASEFEDQGTPTTADGSAFDSVFASRVNRMRHFAFKVEGTKWQTIPPHYSQVIEVVAPEISIVSHAQRPGGQTDPAAAAATGYMGASGDPTQPLSAKLLTKALEIIDEVLKNHCEHLSDTGIYSLNDILHVVPCPLCYGDERPHGEEAGGGGGGVLELEASLDRMVVGGEGEHDPEAAFTPLSPLRNGALPQTQAPPPPPAPAEGGGDEGPPEGCLCVLTADSCIKQTLTCDSISCPTHGPLELHYLAPDLVFADLVDVKLNKNQLTTPIYRDDKPVARGSFGMVYKRTLRTEGGVMKDVAIKVFKQYDAGLPNSAAELTRNYSDMRYELNKLSTLRHPFIVVFVGVLTNPHCFVLEWAPLGSLEGLRGEHYDKGISFCPTSLLLVLLQITDALCYLHGGKVSIVHRDLKCSNILVFHFPDTDHHCFTAPPSLRGCEACLHQGGGGEGGGGVRVGRRGGVLVKVTDMGICANPAAHNAKSSINIRQFVPEYVLHNVDLTEKVDIFALGSCLYELLTLRGLPPSDISEPEYKHMLQAGKRAQFYSKDPPYPIVLFQFLEDCWRQEHYKRPSALSLHRALLALTGLQPLMTGASPSPSSPTRSLRRLTTPTATIAESPSSTSLASSMNGGSLMEEAGLTSSSSSSSSEMLCGSTLLDSYTLDQEGVVIASSAAVSDVSVSLCVALLSHGSTASLVMVQHSLEANRAQLHARKLDDIKNSLVSALHVTSLDEVLVGCEDGTLMLYDWQGRVNSDPASSCVTHGNEHGAIIKIHYNSACRLLVLGYRSGFVHIRSCTQDLRTVLTSGNWRPQFCSAIDQDRALVSLECLCQPYGSHSSLTFELWCGSDSSALYVWSFNINYDTIWTPEALERSRTVSVVDLTSAGVSPHARVTQIALCPDQKLAVAVLQDTVEQQSLLFQRQRSRTVGSSVVTPVSVHKIAVVDLLKKTIINTFTWSGTVTCVAVSGPRLVLGAQSGTLTLLNLETVANGDFSVKPLPQEVLRGHRGCVYALASFPGFIAKDGVTSLFSTFVGQASENASAQFVVSVGAGKGYSSGPKDKVFRDAFKTFSEETGSFINAWLVG